MPVPFDVESIELPEDSEIHALLKACPDIEGVRYADDEFLIHGTDTVKDIFLLLRGNCLVEQPDATKERTPGNELAVIDAAPDEPVFLGEMAYLGGGFRSAAVRSVMATYALRLKPAHLDAIMDGFPALTRVLCRQFALRLGEANVFIKRFQVNNTMTMEQRFLNPGDVVAEAGAPVDKLFQLVDGALSVMDEANTVIRVSDEAPVFIGNQLFFQGGIHPHQIIAKTPAIVVALDKSSEAAIIRNFPELALDLIRKTVERK